MSDAELIQLIIDANKVDVPMDEMPSQSQTVIEEDYNDYMGMAAKKATGLGYEVDLAGVGRRYGDRNEVYFNLEGRKLDPNDWGGKAGTGIRTAGIEMMIKKTGNVLIWFSPLPLICLMAQRSL